MTQQQTKKIPNTRKPKFVWEYEIIDNKNKSHKGFKETIIEESDRFLLRFINNLGYGDNPPGEFKELHIKFIEEK